MDSLSEDDDNQALIQTAEEAEKTHQQRRMDNAFKCDECSKVLRNMKALLKHKLSHNMVVTCDLCHKTFNRKDNLLAHKRKIHGVQATQTLSTCTLCNQTFNRLYNLKRHMIRVHGQALPREKPFKCRHCLEGFSDYPSLFQHVDSKHPLNQSGGRDATAPRSPVQPMETQAEPKTDDAVASREETRLENVESALQNNVQNHYIRPHAEERYDLLTFFANRRSDIENILISRIRRTGGIKWNLCVQVEMYREMEGEDPITTSPYFRSVTYTTLSVDTFEQHDLNEALQKMHSSMEKFLREGSGWHIKRVIKLEIHTIVYRPISGSSYLPLPKTFRATCSLLNIRNMDEKCFTWCVLASLHPVERSPENVNHYFDFEGELNMKDIPYPVKMTSLKKIEQQNANISINVFGYDDNHIIPLRITRETDRLHHVNLFYFKHGEKSHYCLITNLNRFLSRSKSYDGQYHYCSFCLHGFKREDLLKKHRQLCCVHGEQRVELPVKGENDLLEFKEFERTLKVSFTIYCDFETLNKKIDVVQPDPEASCTTPVTKLEVCGFGYKVVCVDPQYTKPTVVYRGQDASSKLIECLLEEQKQIEEILSHPKPMQMTEEDKRNAENATHCCICKKPFTIYDKIHNRPVRHHDHLLSNFIGMAHSICNVNCKQAKHTCVVFHNLKNFDAHILCQTIGQFKDAKLKCIAQNQERYVSFSLNNLRFIDSFQFLPSSLETLVDNLAGSDVEVNMDAFPHLIHEFPSEHHVKLLMRKGVYPYDYMDDWNRFLETELPPKEAFYSNIKREGISDVDYEHAQQVYREFELQNMGQYHDLYLKSDVLNLCSVFESFRNVCMDNYDLDPCHFYTSPGLAWTACLKMTGVQLELMSDIDQMLFIEKGIRGGISQISNRFKEANNPLLDAYDASKPTSYLLDLDFNNLYGWGMIQKLPIGNFEFLTKREIERLDICSIPTDGDIGYILEVSLRYPESLHDAHNDYPLAPERKAVDSNMLSPYAKHLWKKLHGKKEEDELPPRPKLEKLLTTLEDKDNYIVHYRNLQLYLQLGLEIKEVHRVLRFHQEAWMKPFIAFNTSMRQRAKSTFEKYFYKLLNVSVFGKTMENVRKHKNIELVHTEERLRKVSAKPTYKSSKIFSEDLVGVELNRVNLKLFKPSYCGMCILDLSKCIMYDFFYLYLKEKYGDKVQLQLTDTDSLLISCECENIYEDMKERMDLFDTSEYPPDHPLHSNKNKKVLGKMKDETNGVPISAFVGLRSKMYSFTCGGKEEKRAKGIAKATIQKDLRFQLYKDTLFNETQKLSSMSSIRSHSHDLYCETVRKTGLSSFDDKRYLINEVESYAYGHYKIRQNANREQNEGSIFTIASVDDFDQNVNQNVSEQFYIDGFAITPINAIL